ncbi:Hypothetical predicted protein [Paramuricea clavata]|uniref:Uncharacterized protein n=1 Tax=Paramuricea clavata TaxID=317549 RepID=A0A6S7K0J2_PARCT|nr:Hypothetical predicted protein [Paramuricea clavata]
MEITQDKIITRLISFTSAAYKYIKDKDNQKFIAKKFFEVLNKVASNGKTLPDNQNTNLFFIRELSSKYFIETKNLAKFNDFQLEKLLVEVGEKPAGKKLSSTRPTRKAPGIPEGVSPARRERKIPLDINFSLPVTKLKQERSIPKPSYKVPISKLGLSTIPKPEPERSIPELKRPTYVKVSHSFSNLIKKYKIQVVSNDPQIQLTRSIPSLKLIFEKNIEVMRGIKYHINLLVRYIMYKGSGDIDEATYNANHFAQVITNINQLDESLDKSISLVLERVSNFIARGSGWQVKNIEKMDIILNTYSPLEGSSYIDLPKEL